MLKLISIAVGIGFLATAGLAQAKNDLIVGIVLEPPHLDPTAGSAASIDEILYANVFEGLTRINEDGKVAPALASEWSISDDLKTYTFKLHVGVKFHDGTDFDANDVKFTLDRARAPDSVNPQRVLYSNIDDVTVVDPLTVKIHLKTPQGAFLNYLAWGDAVIVAPESAATNKEKPIGTGPFKFEKWVKGSSVTIVRSPSYWGQAPSLEKVEFRIIPDSSMAVPALLSGDIQGFPSFPPDALSQVESDPRYKVTMGLGEGETILGINNAKAPFNNLKVRQAISYAIDRQAVIDGALGGHGKPIGSHMSPANPAYIDLTGVYPHNVEKAKQLLKEAGFPNGFQTTLKLPPLPYVRLGGEVIAAQLRDIGIDAQIVPMEFAQWLDQVYAKHDFDLTMIAHTEPNDIDMYSRKGHYIGYSNPKFDDVIARLAATTDETKRNEILGEAQHMLADDAVVGFLFQLPKIGVWDAGLQGMWTNAPLQANDMTKVHWNN